MRSRHKRQRGQAAVEFALILPLFLLLVFAVTEFGRIWMVQHVLTTASRAGARQAILPSTTEAQVSQTVSDLCTGASLNAELTSVSMSNVGMAGASGSTTEVTVSYNHPVLSGSLIPGLSGSFTLASTTRMRHE